MIILHDDDRRIQYRALARTAGSCGMQCRFRETTIAFLLVGSLRTDWRRLPALLPYLWHDLQFGLSVPFLH